MATTRKTTTLALTLVLAACSRGGGSGGSGGATPPAIQRADEPVPYQYLVVLKPGTAPVAEVAADLVPPGAWVLRAYDRALRGVSVHASEEAATAIAQDPRVAWVAEDGRVRAQALAWQENAPATLDRIDQRTGTNGRYGYHDVAGARVHAYVLDTGVLASHVEFLGRPPDQVDFVRDGGVGDCNGHGTYVAALVGGAAFGVAKKVSLHSLRVLGCDGAGTTSDAIAALDWLLAHAQTPAVANLSFGRGKDSALDAAVEAVVAAGIPVVVAAGDGGRDACATSPARAPSALTVGATDLSGAAVAPFSNHGPCVDLFAPGVDVRSAFIEDRTDPTYGGSVVQSGTSASAPLVAGAVALYLGRNTGASPDAVARALFANSTRAPATIPAYTPDRFLFTTFVDDDNSLDREVPVVSVDAPAGGATVSGTSVPVTVTATDDVGVTRVELFASGRFLASADAPPYAFTWNTREEPNGTASLVARAYDRAGNATDATVAVTVSNPGIAHYDAALGVPRCETVAPICDSVDLLAGRDALGPERNAPNVLADACPTASDPAATCTCPDGRFGKYQLDESIERITVTAAQGDLATGTDVDVAVEVWVASAYWDALDLYSSPRVAVPAWRYLGTLQPVASGLQTLTARFTLPAGSPQAVRAAFRHGGDPKLCTDGGFDERDDLAFAVASGNPDTTPPHDVTLDEPHAGAKLAGTVPVRASAGDDHLVSRVEFTAGPVLVGTDFTQPYEIAWKTFDFPNGTYELRATAYDGAGNATTSAPVSVEVKDDTPPTVSISYPANGAHVVSTPVVVRAGALDDGRVAQVELWECTGACVTACAAASSWHYVTADASGPTYELTWSRSPGTYCLRARAVDGAKNEATSAAVQVYVGDANPPTCSVKAPADTTVVGDVLLEAEAVDDTEVASVAFYQVGGAGAPDVPLGTSASAPFTARWESGRLVNASYQLYCIATDTSGNTTPDARRLTLTANDTRDPTVAMLFPAVTYDPPGSGTVVATPVEGVISVEAGAADDGAVRSVEFYLDDPPVLLATLDAAPWAFTWNSGTIANGPHTLFAKAYDYNAHSATSATRSIVTNDHTAPAVAILYPSTGATVTGVVPVRAQVSDPGGAVVKVELLDGDTVLETSTAAPTEAPYEFAWAADAATLGAHTLTVRATDLGGNAGTASITVTVESTTAAYDDALGAPACTSVGTRCQTSLLLDGRGKVGPEVHASNTLWFACPADPTTRCQCVDGDEGAYHADESIDFVAVSSQDGGDLTGGALVDVEIRAWIFDPTVDRVQLFYAADATKPVWVALPGVPLGTAAGPQTLHTSYRLPHGPEQALRVSIRSETLETGPCASGPYNDHDDLVFAVAPAPDATPPTVSIASPAEGAPVGGIVPIQATASDDVAIASVTFLVDGNAIGTASAAPYAWDWDTRGLAPGPRTLVAVATDYAGNSTTSAAVTVTVVDQVDPTASLAAPMAQETVMGTIALAADAADDVGVTKVQFLVDDVVVATDDAAPYEVTWNSASVGDGVHTISAKAFDAAGHAGPSAPVAILVSNFGNASYDHQLSVPACARPGAKCFTGTLVDGRGPLGPEPNEPNTLDATCGDGIQGTYHLDESIDAITVRSPTGDLTAGADAIVEVKIWAGSSWALDALDVFSTADAAAASPTWHYEGTVAPTRAGAQVLSLTYPLPSTGTVQAVRAQFRFGGEPTVNCSQGTFDDRDDLAFAVSP